MKKYCKTSALRRRSNLPEYVDGNADDDDEDDDDVDDESDDASRSKPWGVAYDGKFAVRQR